MERVVVVGAAGAGKTSVARHLSVRLGVPHIELDALFWERDWTPTPMPRFERRVEEATRGPGWVVDGNYGDTIKAITWSRADTLVWLDLSSHGDAAARRSDRATAAIGRGAVQRQPGATVA